MSENITIHQPGLDALSGVVVVLLIIFFPIGIIVFITRSINKNRILRAEANETKANTNKINTETSMLQSEELERYHNLFQRGIISQAEYDAKKNNILFNSKMKKRAIAPAIQRTLKS